MPSCHDRLLKRQRRYACRLEQHISQMDDRASPPAYRFRYLRSAVRQQDCLAAAAGPDSLGAMSEQDCLQLNVTPSEHMKREI
jgi:hypothetical protein